VPLRPWSGHNWLAGQLRKLGIDYRMADNWSVDQCEYATDVVFRKQADLQAIYENMARTAIHTVKPDNIATFLGRKLSTQYEGEMGNRFNIRIEGTRIDEWHYHRYSLQAGGETAGNPTVTC
jgi:hypothetical protein